ncbi:hypothetical protein Dimus_030739 [Dionaea muscipula]
MVPGKRPGRWCLENVRADGARKTSGKMVPGKRPGRWCQENVRADGAGKRPSRWCRANVRADGTRQTSGYMVRGRFLKVEDPSHALWSAGLATAPADFAASPLQSSVEPPSQPTPEQHDPSSSDKSDDDFSDDSDDSGSKDDSDDSSSSSESLPLQTRPRQPAHAPTSEGPSSSLSLIPHSSSVVDHDAEPFVREEDPAEDEFYVDIMSDLDHSLAPDS